jgi:hypothetical protein
LAYWAAIAQATGATYIDTNAAMHNLGNSLIDGFFNAKQALEKAQIERDAADKIRAGLDLKQNTTLENFVASIREVNRTGAEALKAAQDLEKAAGDNLVKDTEAAKTAMVEAKAGMVLWGDIVTKTAKGIKDSVEALQKAQDDIAKAKLANDAAAAATKKAADDAAAASIKSIVDTWYATNADALKAHPDGKGDAEGIAYWAAEVARVGASAAKALFDGTAAAVTSASSAAAQAEMQKKTATELAATVNTATINAASVQARAATETAATISANALAAAATHAKAASDEAATLAAAALAAAATHGATTATAATTLSTALDTSAVSAGNVIATAISTSAAAASAAIATASAASATAIAASTAAATTAINGARSAMTVTPVVTNPVVTNPVVTNPVVTAPPANTTASANNAMVFSWYKNNPNASPPTPEAVAYWAGQIAILGADSVKDSFAGTVAQLTGTDKLPIEQFANGGDFAGGVRIVGERGPEVELTGASRIFTASQTAEMFKGGNSEGNAALLEEVKALREETKATRVEMQAMRAENSQNAHSMIQATKAGTTILRDVTRGGDSLNVVIAPVGV